MALNVLTFFKFVLAAVLALAAMPHGHVAFASTELAYARARTHDRHRPATEFHFTDEANKAKCKERYDGAVGYKNVFDIGHISEDVLVDVESIVDAPKEVYEREVRVHKFFNLDESQNDFHGESTIEAKILAFGGGASASFDDKNYKKTIRSGSDYHEQERRVQYHSGAKLKYTEYVAQLCVHFDWHNAGLGENLPCGQYSECTWKTIVAYDPV